MCNQRSKMISTTQSDGDDEVGKKNKKCRLRCISTDGINNNRTMKIKCRRDKLKSENYYTFCVCFFIRFWVRFRFVRLLVCKLLAIKIGISVLEAIKLRKRFISFNFRSLLHSFCRSNGSFHNSSSAFNFCR